MDDECEFTCLEEREIGTPRHPSFQRRYGRLATLCDDPNGLTCSFHVASEAKLADEVLPFPSFEEAALAAKGGIAEAFLVPGAYPRLNSFIMDEGLIVHHAFVQTIPALVFAVPETHGSADLEAIYHHPAVTPLLPEIGVRWKNAIPASSNSEACKMLLSAPVRAGCVTNILCARHFRLKTLKILRGGIRMPWLCIGASPGTGARA